MGALQNVEFGDLHSYNPRVFVMRLSLLPHPAEYEGTGPSHLSLLRLELVEQSAVKTPP